MTEPVLEINGLRQSYGTNEVLKSLSLSVGRGEILGLIGENGAGKSTFVKCVVGMLAPTAGTIDCRCSVAAIHQDLNLADDLPVFANFFLGRESTVAGFLRRREMADRARRGFAAMGLEVDPFAPTSSLSTSEKQLLEIARALDVNAGLLILDEPTALLNTEETGRLFETMRSLRARGTSMIYISHRLGEIHEICDRVAILRDGELTCVSAASAMTQKQMAEMMVGRELADIYPAVPTPGGGTAFSFRSPGIGSFSIGAMEIVGFSGLADAGQIELCETIAGLRRPAPGTEIEIDGVRREISSPRDAVAAGIGILSPDRLATGLWRDFTIADNIALGAFGKMTSLGFASARKIEAAARAGVDDFRIKCGGTGDAVSSLSGGNQQKVSLAKVLAAGPRVVFLNEPTQGVDVGARQEIYASIAALAAKGVAVAIVSSDMTELLGLCRRIIVMRDGAIAGELSGDALTEKDIIRLATGT